MAIKGSVFLLFAGWKEEEELRRREKLQISNIGTFTAHKQSSASVKQQEGGTVHLQHPGVPTNAEREREPPHPVLPEPGSEAPRTRWSFHRNN